MGRRSTTIIAGLIVAVLLLPSVVFAQSGFAKLLGVPSDDLRLLIIRIFQIFWVLVGIAGAGLAGYGLYLHRTASDDVDEQDHAKNLVLIGAAGIIVAIVVVVVLAVVFNKFSGTIAQEESPIEFEFPVQSFGEYLSASSAIKETYPVRDAKNVPRNARIIISFNESVRIESLRDSKKKIRTDALRIQQVFPQEEAIVQRSATVESNSDHTIISITPDEPLGEAKKKSTFAVTLTKAILNEKGESIFSSRSGYSWQFEVSGLDDTTPPSVESALPLPQFSSGTTQQRYPYNHLIQITFSESIDPLSLSGDRIQLLDTKSQSQVLGSVSVGNEFRTVTFLPRTSCGKNACGETMFCLPQKTSFTASAKAAALAKTFDSKNPNRAEFPYSGIVDIAGNSLDGGGLNGEKKNGKAEGPETDSFSWSFATSNEFSLEPPTVTFIEPSRDGTKIDVKKPIQADFSTFMDATSLHSNSLILAKDQNYWISSSHDISKRNTVVKINHDGLKINTVYTPQIQSLVRSITQQCFNPCIGPAE